jgi:cytochrome c-type biogenesis protein CcmH
LILPFLLALLAFGALLPIVAPLLRGSRPVASRGSFDQAVYRDQLQELDRDIARGLLTPADAHAARLEIQRRLLAADKLPAAPPRLSRSPVLALIVFVVIAAGSISSYLWLGAPSLPDEPFSARQAELARENGPSSMQQATAALAAKLKQNPSDAAGWLLYARSLSELREWDQAEDAYRHAMDLGQTGPGVVSDHAETLVMQAGGAVTPAAEAAFQHVLKADPHNPIARYYLAVAAMQAGEPRQAINGFQSLLAEMPSDSPLRPQLGQRVAEAAHAAGIPVPALATGASPTPGPTPDSMANAANMTDERRQAMIGGMVAKLAAEQQANPTNLEGWLRLGQAYAVLHQPDKASDAYDRAAKLRPDDASIPLQEVRALLSDQAPTDRLPPRVIALLKQVETTRPDEPLVLWYLGLAAAQDARFGAARDDWGRLLAKLPPGGDDAKMVQSAIDALAKR